MGNILENINFTTAFDEAENMAKKIGFSKRSIITLEGEKEILL